LLPEPLFSQSVGRQDIGAAKVRCFSTRRANGLTLASGVSYPVSQRLNASFLNLESSETRAGVSMADTGTHTARVPVADEFMLHEYDRIIDAYHNLHEQKNELIKFYLAFVSVPVTVVVIFLSLFKYLHQQTQSANLLGGLQLAAIFLSLLLVAVGISVLRSLLSIRVEQYLYIKTINAARCYFRTVGKIEKKYLVLPSCGDEITFGEQDKNGRPFWEAMIIGSANSFLIAFLTACLTYKILGLNPLIWIFGGFALYVSLLVHAHFVRAEIQKGLDLVGVRDLGPNRS
jgi:hypothetical protein